LLAYLLFKVVHLKKQKKTFAFTHPHVIQDVHAIFFFSRKEFKVFDENITGFLHTMDFNAVQTVQSPNESFCAALKGFKRHQTMNKGLI